jgi:group I intron endonuclease
MLLVINSGFLLFLGLRLLFYSLNLGFYYFLLLVCSPIYPIFIAVVFSFDDLAGLFANFISTVLCGGAVDPFPVVQQFTDLSSLNTKNMVKEAYSGVSGIYMFQCTETGGTYIGSSVDLYGRFSEHLNAQPSNPHFQNAANKYGWDSFIFCVIETCPSSELASGCPWTPDARILDEVGMRVAIEQSNLDILFNNFPKALIYNICAVAYSTLGYTHTAETKALMSAALQGNTNRLGTTHTAEAKAAISAALVGNTNSVGRIITTEAKAAMSKAKSGENHPMHGKTHTAESINQIRINNPNRMSIFVYDHETQKLVGEFHSQRQAAKIF